MINKIRIKELKPDFGPQCQTQWRRKVLSYVCHMTPRLHISSKVFNFPKEDKIMCVGVGVGVVESGFKWYKPPLCRFLISREMRQTPNWPALLFWLSWHKCLIFLDFSYLSRDKRFLVKIIDFFFWAGGGG